MHYELYVDSLIWINFWMNLYLLALTNRSTLRTATPQSLFGGAVLGTLGFILPIICVPYLLAGIGMGIVLGVIGMLIVTFRVRRWKMFVRLMEQMLFYSFCMGGGLLFLSNLAPGWKEILTRPIGFSVVSGVLFVLIYRIKAVNCEKKCTCIARVKAGNRMQEVTALIDSGNSLVEPISGKPVSVIERSVCQCIWEESPPGFRVIPYHSIGRKRGVMPGYLLEELEVDYEGIVLNFQNVYVAVSEEEISNTCEDKSIKIIINPMLFREKRNGRPSRRQNERRNDFKSGNAGKNAV